jgi:molybdopterin molybdotransferase
VNTREFLGLDEALALLRASVVPLGGPAESIALAAAANRVVADTINAPMNVPPFTASAMDGYAVCTTDPIFTAAPPYAMPLQGESMAGTPFAEPLRTDHTVRIFTGAAMPERSDAVVIQESRAH